LAPLFSEPELVRVREDDDGAIVIEPNQEGERYLGGECQQRWERKPMTGQAKASLPSSAAQPLRGRMASG
jgi:hypothetical protein